MKKTLAAVGLLTLAFTQSAAAFNMNTAPQPARDWSYAASCLSSLPQPEHQSVVRYRPQPYSPERLPALLAEDPYEIIFSLRHKTADHEDERIALMKKLTFDMARAAVDHALPVGNKDATLRAARKTLDKILADLPTATRAQKQALHEDAYKLRVNLEKRGFASHYVDAAHAVAMATSHSPSLSLYGNDRRAEGDPEWVALYLTANAMEDTLLSDLGRALKRDLRRPSDEIRAAAEQQGLIQSCDKDNWWGDESILREMGRQDALHRARDLIYKSATGFKPG